MFESGINSKIDHHIWITSTILKGFNVCHSSLLSHTKLAFFSLFSLHSLVIYWFRVRFKMNFLVGNLLLSFWLHQNIGVTFWIELKLPPLKWYDDRCRCSAIEMYVYVSLLVHFIKYIQWENPVLQVKRMMIAEYIRVHGECVLPRDLLFLSCYLQFQCSVMLEQQ